MRYIVGGFLSLAAAFATMYFVPQLCTSLIGSLAVFVALLLLMVAFPLLIMIGMDIEMRVFHKNLCHECQNEKIFSRQLPFCQKCLDKSLTKTMDLQVEAEKRILLAQENSWPSQEEAARNWFQQSLPQPQKWFLQKGLFLHSGSIFLGSKNSIQTVSRNARLIQQTRP